MSEIPQTFKDAIETEWRHDDERNADTLTMKFRALARNVCYHEDAEMFKDQIEEHTASELYKLVLKLVRGECHVTTRSVDYGWGLEYSYDCCGFVSQTHPHRYCPNCGAVISSLKR